MPLKLLVIDDHPLVQEGVAAALESLGPDMRIVTATSAEQGLALAAQHPELDLVLLDLALPGMSGFAAIGRLRERFPSLPIVVLSALEDAANVRRAIEAGAIGFIPKSAAPQVLLEVLRQVLAGNVSAPALQEAGARVERAAEGATAELDPALLTLRQLEVLARVCQGKTNKQIATELNLSEKTIKAHVTAIFKILGVVNRTQAVLVARRVGMVAN